MRLSIRNKNHHEMESNTWKWGAAVTETYITGYFESEPQRKAGRVARGSEKLRAGKMVICVVKKGNSW